MIIEMLNIFEFASSTLLYGHCLQPLTLITSAERHRKKHTSVALAENAGRFLIFPFYA